jgi:type II secretory pathway component PulF
MTNLENPLGGANLLVLVFLGVAVMWSVRLIYAGRRSDRDWLRRLLNLAGAVLALVGGAGLLVSLAGASSLWLLVIAAIVLLMAVSRFRAAERRALLSMLAIAAEKGIPLPVAVRVFADRRDDEMGDRFLNMAELLEGGVALPWALERSGNALPTTLRAAVDIGDQTGALGPALRKTLSKSDEIDLALRRVVEKYLYLAAVLAVASAALAFIIWRIIPIFDNILAEFAVEPPPVTQLLFDVGRFLIEWPALPALAAVLVWSTLLLIVLYYVGALPTDVFLVDRLAATNDRASVLRALALAVRGRRPLAEALRVLSWRYPKHVVRRRLEKASKSIDGGGDWREALRNARLITPAESAVLGAAEKVGNLGWALEEMADGAQRRLILRLRSWLAVIFPVVILSFGAFVLLVAVGLFAPLALLVEKMA